MVKNYKKFLWSIIIFLLILNLLYLVIFDNMVKKDTLISSSYQHFLLENTSSPRLIIESGSNSTYAIDSYEMSQAVHLQTINLSDNASNSLRYKLLRLEKYTKKGDVVLLPLEWQYYSRNKLTVPFTERIFSPHHHYYKDLSLIESIQLAYQIPFGSLVKRVKDIISRKKENTSLVEFRRLQQFIEKYNNGDRGAIQQQHKVRASKLDNYGIENCYDYIFLTQIENGFVISDTFKENVKLMKRLQKKGVKVLVTWAGVTGEDCYAGIYKKEAEKFSKEVKDFLTKKGIPLLGNIYDSEFSNAYMYNTFYHLLYQAKMVRTRRLIKRINFSPYAIWFDKDRNITSNGFEKLYLKVKKKLDSYIINYQNSSKIVFLLGWYRNEDWGRWSRGEHSSMLLFIDKEKRGKEIKIKIKSIIYGKKTKVKISVNGQKIAFLDLEGEHTITLPTSKERTLMLVFDYTDVKSPNEIEPKNSDTRKIKLGIESIEIVD